METRNINDLQYISVKIYNVFDGACTGYQQSREDHFNLNMS